MQLFCAVVAIAVQVNADSSQGLPADMKEKLSAVVTSEYSGDVEGYAKKALDQLNDGPFWSYRVGLYEGKSKEELVKKATDSFNRDIKEKISNYGCSYNEDSGTGTMRLLCGYYYLN
ncbi:hypothetical protein ANCCAN_13591 [Ancylostoma caninum]|uniref:Uncharacterized protein n=1 Tax=Ancylostoma caninum TaxID=29170 RepID=A0A368G9W0_ANCCA|nr:hypothetical protein ANCCAN_13591 [Ancylostoma caninum]